MNSKVAERIARHAHKGQVDKGGEDYINHPERIVRAMKMLGYPDPVLSVAWLHDVVEDTHIDIDHLRQAGFSDDVLEAVDAITQRKKEHRDSYYGRVMTSDIARAVKHFDVGDNSSPTRMAKLKPETQERLGAKYVKAREILGDPLTPEHFT